MYLEYFNLQEKPFGLPPNPKFLFLSEQHREALEYLLYGIHHREGLMVVSGAIGTGKTTLCRALLEQLDKGQVTTALVLNPMLPLDDLLRTILEGFRLSSQGNTRKELLDELRDFLAETMALGKIAVLVIDEAQNLSTSCLELVRMLTNIETEEEKLIQIVLVGTEELPLRLKRHAFRHLQQRITLRYHLGPLDHEETRSYVQHRLTMAGAAGGISFERHAYREIYLFSKGVPRLINMIAERTLLAAYLAGSPKVRRIHVLEGRQSLGGETPGSWQLFSHWFVGRWQPVSLAVGLMVIAIGLVMTVPEAWENGRRYVQALSVPMTVGPVRTSRHVIRAAIPLTGPGVRQAPALEKARKPERGIVGSRVVKRQGTKEVVSTTSALQGEKRRSVASRTFGTNGPEKELPQFLFKPPYIYTVQVEAFKDKKFALARMRKLRQRGLDAWVAWVDLGDEGIWYRVLLGKYEKKAEAAALALQLKNIKEFSRARQLAAHAGVLSQTSGASQ